MIDLFKSDGYKSLHGWCTTEKAIRLFTLAKSIDNPTCVELGVFAGKSLLPIALGSDRGSVYGVDAWEKDATLEGENDIENDKWWANIDYDYFYLYTKQLLEKYNITNCKLLRNKSCNIDVLNLFENESIDILHQDSNHSELISTNEVYAWRNKIKKGGYYIFDDTNWKTTMAAQNLLLDSGFIELEDFNTWKIYRKNI